MAAAVRPVGKAAEDAETVCFEPTAAQMMNLAGCAGA